MFLLYKEGYSKKSLSTLPYFSIKNNKLRFDLDGLIIFPIRDKDEEIIAFSGRSYKEKIYLNMRSNEYFSRGNHLFYLNDKKLQEQDELYIVEGYFDALSLAKINKFAVATMGAQITDNQKHMLKSFQKDLVIALDSDIAGINAAVKLSNELNINKFVYTEQYKDVDELVNNNVEIKILNRLEYINAIIQRSDFSIDLLVHLHKVEKIAFFRKYLSTNSIEDTIEYFIVFDDFFALLRMQLIKERDIINHSSFNKNLFKDKVSYSLILENAVSQSTNMQYDEELVRDVKLWSYYNIQVQLMCMEESLPSNIAEFMKCKVLLEQIKSEIK